MDLNKWTVIRLKDACTRRKVEVAGKKKADLVESLTTYLRGKLLMIKYAIYRGLGVETNYLHFSWF